MTSKREIKIGCIQMRTMPNTTKEEKVEHAASLVERAAKEEVKIILLGELFTVDYDLFYMKKDPKTFELGESVPGPTTGAIGQVTKKYGVYVIAPLFEKAAPGLYYNAAPLIGPDGTVVGNYRKTQVAGVKAMEKMYFRAGQDFQAWQTEFWPNAKFSTIICHDRRYPETSRIVSFLGAEIMFCPTAAPGYAGGVHWDVVNRARAVDNGLFAVYSNRVGKEIQNDYFGESMIVNPRGEIIASAGHKVDEVIAASVDLAEVDSARIDVPTLRDIRHDLCMRYYSPPRYDELIGKKYRA